MKLTVVGCSPAWPNPGSAHSGYLLDHEGHRLLLDCGPGVLARLRAGAADPAVNLMPAIVDASRAYVTMGEMCDAFREVWGTWRETPVF